MSEKMTKGKKVRLTVDLTPTAYERIQRMEALMDSGSKADMVRQALQLLEFIVQRTEEGSQFKLVHEDGSEEKVVFLHG